MNDPMQKLGSTAPLFEQREIHQPERRGHVPIADTSQTAWQRKHGKLSSEYMLVLAYLRDNGPSVHDDMVAAGVLVQSSSGRMGELVAKGLIEVVGRRKTRSGSDAKLCTITQAGREAFEKGMQ